VTVAEPWTTLRLLNWTQGYFAQKGIDSPRLTAEVLLAHALSCDRVRLYLDFDKPLGVPELASYRELVRRRADREPTAYLVGEKEFCGRRFRVDPRVLVPRPETELVLEAALGALPSDGRALDLCTGSGALGVTLALERPASQVVATDLSPEALEVARDNAARLGAGNVTFLAGDLYEPVAPDLRFDVIVSNPPYVPRGELDTLPGEVRREPRLALDGGEDGLAISRRIVAGAPPRLRPGGALVLEMHESHLDALPAICLECGFARAEARRDLAGLPRLVVAHMAGEPRPA
jgi:release factor glutamine methyltransferase